MAQRTGLPVVHLDVLFWRACWTRAPLEESRAELAAAVAGESWILDGNFLGLEKDDPRFACADTVVFLDLPRAVCLWRVLWRLARDRGSARPDLPEGCGEGFDLPLLHWIWRYPRDDRPRVLRILAGLDGADVRRLRSRGDVRRFVGTI
jgi:adenylate kinase family enzyme